MLYQHQVFVLAGGAAIILTGAAKALHREKVDGLVDEALASLRVRER